MIEDTIFVMHTPAHRNRFTFHGFVKNNTYSYLHFVPVKNSPEKVKMVVTMLEKNDNLIGVYTYFLELDSFKRRYKEHYVGLVHDGSVHKVIFTALHQHDDSPVGGLSMGIAVVKIKDGNDDDKGGRPRRRPKRPTPVYDVALGIYK